VRWVESDGTKLHTLSIGDGPLLVMCHGLVTASLATWYLSAAPALARHHQVVLYDMRGHGKSELAATGYDLDTLARDLAQVIRAYLPRHALERPGTVALVGHSYGALVALQYALRSPQRVARLALIDAPLPAVRYVRPSLADVDSPAALQQHFPVELEVQDRRGARQRRRARERLEFLLLRSSLREDLRTAVDVPDALLRALNVPTLCLYGRHSDCAAAGSRLASLMPQAALRWLDCGHFIPTQAPAAMTEHLVTYFAPRVQEVDGHAARHVCG
jgi:pimeloyl-ACP methyl ester carboxylesterase